MVCILWGVTYWMRLRTSCATRNGHYIELTADREGVAIFAVADWPDANAPLALTCRPGEHWATFAVYDRLGDPERIWEQPGMCITRGPIHVVTRKSDHTVVWVREIGGIYSSQYIWSSGKPQWEVRIKYWLALTFFGVVPCGRLVGAAVSIQRQKCVRARRLCPHCGYDLRATPERCPECGTARPAE
jgi:hypothetical protein